MKLLRHGPVGNEKPGLLDDRGTIRDLSKLFPDLAGDSLRADTLAQLRTIDVNDLPKIDPQTRLGPCVGDVRHFIAVGLNYVDHALETNSPIPNEPILFNKAPSCIVGPNDDVILPKGSVKTDWECELAIVIGESASYVSEADALSVVAGYCICNDVSEREFQMERGGQWMKGKGCPTFGPLGPWLVTPDEVGDVQNLSMSLKVNGQIRQNGSTKTMIFGVRQLISYISQFMQLQPGDVITTGTPPGVGLGMNPPQYLQPGDLIELSIEQLGHQRQRVRAFGT